jgi:hypothetical protein
MLSIRVMSAGTEGSITLFYTRGDILTCVESRRTSLHN